MSQWHRIKDWPLVPSRHDGPNVQLDLHLRSEVSAISPFVDKLMRLVRNLNGISGNEEAIEIALREALANAVIHGNQENSSKKVHVGCLCGTSEVSFVVRDEGCGFDIGEVPDPTAPENLESGHGRGIYLMKSVMDEVRFEQGGTVVFMRKSAKRRHA